MLDCLPSTLRTLYLSWEPGLFFVELCQMDGALVKPDTSALLRFLRNCPNMSKLNLLYFFVGSEDICQMLKAVGRKLDEFQVAITGSDATLKGFERIVMELLVSNPHIRSLQLPVFDPGLDGRKEEEISNATFKKSYNVMVAVAVLHRHAANLDTMPLRHAIDFTMQQVEKDRKNARKVRSRKASGRNHGRRNRH